MKTIIGGGLAGLIAAHAWPQATILEAAPGPMAAHHALLRFRSDAVSKLTGIEFSKVRVHKGIFYNGDFVQPSIRMANLYAQKVLGNQRLVGDRSIWNLDPVDRFIAPENFYEQLIDSVGARLQFGVAANFAMAGLSGPVVSTAPLSVVLAQLNDPPTPIPAFKRSAIRVRRWRLPNAHLFQTVYFTDERTPLYRASITGDIVIAEMIDLQPFAEQDDWLGETVSEVEELIEQAFGISLDNVEFLDDVPQKFGKIEPMPDAWRKQILYWLTHTHNIFSLGRFATWRNVLLDDVVDDIAVIKRLVRSATPYDRRKVLS